MEQKKKKGNEVVGEKEKPEKVEWGRDGHWGAGVSRLGAGGWRESRIKVDGSPWGKGKEKPEKSFLKFNFFPALFLPTSHTTMNDDRYAAALFTAGSVSTGTATISVLPAFFRTS